MLPETKVSHALVPLVKNERYSVFDSCFIDEKLSHNGEPVTRGGGGGTPYNGLDGEAPPERGTFFRLQGPVVQNPD